VSRAADAAPRDWLGETRQLDLSHPKVRITAHKLTQSKQTLPARAAAIQNFVRRLPYQLAPNSSGLRASDVLRQRRGDAYSKAVLFVALCRAAGLPARLLLLRVQPSFLQGLLRRCPRVLPHIVGQVHLAGEWRSTDGYVLDPVLFAQAKQQLRAEDGDSGWGVVIDADGVWDGHGDCLHQIRRGDVQGAYGVYDDPSQFFGQAGALAAWSWRAWHALSALLLNRRVHRLRGWRPPVVA
jgi:transglutaminase-like putative cysteine protease